MTMQMKKLAAWPSRSGRNLQRYNQELRLVVGYVFPTFLFSLFFFLKFYFLFVFLQSIPFALSRSFF